MATDPRRLRPRELCILLNSTPLGEVITERQLYRHRTRAGLRIGDSRHVDLLRYAAWLVSQRHAPKPQPESEAERYEKLKERARARNVAAAIAGRDIGDLPAVVDPARKRRAAGDFRFFCESYFPLTFHLNWSDDHLKVIERVEQAVLRGGLFALAMPRGSGKTTICECACIWAVLNGHREFVCLIGSDEAHAMAMLDSIKTELDGNDLLLEDYPEVVYPIQALDGIANRCNGQLYQGQRTHIGWTAREVVLPTIAGSNASGAIIKVAGITGRIRGMKYKRADGRTVRPSLVVLDDPQTDESARSAHQVEYRLSVLNGAILNLAGPGQRISVVMPCTVIQPNDMADQILDAKLYPEWAGQRTKALYAFPKNMSLWDKYQEIRSEGFANNDRGAAAREFYLKNRKEMEEGAVVAWPDRKSPEDVSALSHLMDQYYRVGEEAFFAEFQNEPVEKTHKTDIQIQPNNILSKINNIPRGEAPVEAEYITCFIDVHQNLLYYMVAAWATNFTGYVIDYGTYPEQRRSYFSLNKANPTLMSKVKSGGLEAAIYAGLNALTTDLSAREWPRPDGAMMTIDKIMIDANWGPMTDVVYQFCRQSSARGIIIPSHGRYVGASSHPFSEYKKKTGDRVGDNWRIPNVQGRRAVRHVVYDTNFWKSFIFSRLMTDIGGVGSLSLYGSTPATHKLLADHLTAEYSIRTEGRGRVVDEWRLKADRPDNHWLDCLVGCAVAASILGVTYASRANATKTRRRLNPVELANRNRGRHHYA